MKRRMIDVDDLINDMKKIRYFCGKNDYEADLELFDDDKQRLFDYFNDLYDIIGIELDDEMADELTLSKETALEAWKQMYSEIDKENWLFVGTINPQMVRWAIIAIEGMVDYERNSEQREHDILYEPTYNVEDGSM